MNRKLILNTVTSALILMGTSAIADPIFVDSFESADMSTSNAFGFKWSPNNRTSIVTSEKVVYSNGEKTVLMPQGREWEAKEGNHALRFRYPAGQPMAEQRFSLGGAYPEIWLRYWLRVPINYKHGTGNYKFLSLWMDSYNSTAGGKIVWEYLPTGVSGDSTLDFAFEPGNDGRNSGHRQLTPFIDASEDRGRWMEIVVHAKTSSPGEANDGLIELWRRWEDESSYTQIHKKTDVKLAFPAGGPNGWNGGFLMGWANDGYAQDTEWLLDSFTVDVNSLLRTDFTSDTQADRPNPPVLEIN